MARQRKVAKLLLREAYVFDDLFEKRPRDVADVHGDGGEHLSRDRIGEVAVARFADSCSKLKPG
jgi:hypothetical protein